MRIIEFSRQLLSFFIASSFFIGNASIAQDEPPASIVQPGAPGQVTQDIDPDKASEIADTSYTPDDVEFMQGMIVHHRQATVMSEMANDRTNSSPVLDLAGRIIVTQEDEIDFMQGWLEDRGEHVTDPENEHNMHAHHEMAGMASPSELEELRNSKSTDFDRLFLKLMINHHDGAIKMVDHLRKQRGSAYDPILNEFASDVVNDQSVEIERMNYLLVSLSDDPRAGLAAGLYDADEAIMNLELIASLKKPVGFFDPATPSERYEGKKREGEEEEKENLQGKGH